MESAQLRFEALPSDPETRDTKEAAWWVRAGRHIAAAAVFALLMELGRFMPIDGLNQSVFLLWPATGFALGIVIRGGFNYLATFFAVSLLWAGFSLGFGWIFAVERSLATVLTVGLAALLLRRLLNDRYALEDIKSVFIFLLVGPVLTGVLLAVLTTVALCSTAEAVPWSEFSRLLMPWWLAEAVGILVLAPFSLVWTARTKINWSNRQVFEVAVWLIVLMFVGLVVFGNWAPTDTLRYPLELAMFPILCWSAIRFGQRGATAGVLIVALLAVWEILQVLGPAQKYISTQPEFIWVFVGVLSATTFFLAAIIAEVLRREEKAAANEQHLQAFIDALPDVAFVISEEGEFRETYASRQGAVYREADQWKGDSIDMHARPELAAAFRRTIRDALDSGQPQRLQYSHPVDGEDFWFEGRVAPMTNASLDSRQVIWVAYEITERKKAEAALEVRDRVLQGVAEATTAMLASKDLDDGIGQALDSIGSYAQVDSIRLVLGSGESHAPKKESPPPWRWTQAPFAKLTGTEKEPSLNWSQLREDWIQRLKGGEVVRSSIEECEGKIAEQFEKRGIHTILLVPVFVEGEFFGALELCDKERRAWEESEIASLRVASGSMGSFIQSRRSEKHLREAKEAADRANMAKGEFLAMMSHEIRTPMNAVLGYTDLLAQTQVDAQQREWLGIVNRSGKALLELINNILDYSKIESRGVELEYQIFGLERTIMEALELILVKANQKGVKIDYEFLGETPGDYIGDSHRLRQVLLNLVNNAVKFTDEGGVKVSVEITPTEEMGRDRIDLRVKDSGVGIPPEKLERLFQPFTQADSSTTRRFGGTGLGLVISKRLVEKMGGDIAVESVAGEGSTFWFHVFLNRAPASPRPVGERSASDDQVPLAQRAPLEILAVEDEPVNQQLTRDVLAGMGYGCDIAANDVEMRRCLETDKAYTCILMDIQLPGKNGLDLTREIRSGEFGERYQKVYVIAVTANALPGDRKKCLDAGANDYLSKPLVLDELKDALFLAHEKKSV